MRKPTLFTISASRLLLLFTTLFVARNCWYWVVAILCNSASDTSFAWFRPVIGFLEQASAKAAARNTALIFPIIASIFLKKTIIIPNWANGGVALSVERD